MSGTVVGREGRPKEEEEGKEMGKQRLTRNRTLERYPDDKEWQQTVREEIQKKSRDNARTPMQVSFGFLSPLFPSLPFPPTPTNNNPVGRHQIRRLLDRRALATRDEVVQRNQRRKPSRRQRKCLRALGIDPQLAQDAQGYLHLRQLRAGGQGARRRVCVPAHVSRAEGPGGRKHEEDACHVEDSAGAETGGGSAYFELRRDQGEGWNGRVASVRGVCEFRFMKDGG